MRTGVKLVTTLSGGGGVPAWVDSALFDADYENSRFYAGRLYADETAFNTALNLTKSGVTRVTSAPYIDPAGTNQLTNGDFSDGVTGWTAQGTGGSIASVGGELELTAGGSLNGFYQTISNKRGRAFRFRATGRRGTSGNAQSVRVANNNVLNNATQIGADINSTSPTTVEGYASIGATTFYFGARNTSGSGSGTSLWDDLSMVEAWPFAGWTHGAFAVAIKATAPAAAAVDQVLWQSDANNERDRARLVRLVADDTLHLIVTADNTETANLNLGVVADNAQFEVAASIGEMDYRASLNGGVIETDTNGGWPGCTHMRIGRSFTGDTWTGTIQRVTVF